MPPERILSARAAGTWRFEQDRVEIEPFASLPSRALRELGEEGERLADLHRDGGRRDAPVR